MHVLRYAGCLLTNNHTTGHIDPATVAWNQTDMVAAFIECPDVFPLGGTGKHVAIASLYNWHAGGYYTNEWFLGTIANSTRFVLEDRGLLDYGQYYAARTGSATQDPLGRRVLFSATGWHNPQGMDGSCKGQYHLIPRDMGLDAQGRVTFSPIPELASLHQPGTRVVHELPAAAPRGGSDGGKAVTAAAVLAPQPRAMRTNASGSMLELQLNCTGAPTSPGAHGDVVGIQLLASDDLTQYTTVGFNYTSQRLFVSQKRSSAAGLLGGRGGLMQTAPLRGGLGPDGLQLFVLLDYALIEAFANRRAVLSSWVGQIMWKDTPAPADRKVFALPPPEGVTCRFQAWGLTPLLPPNPLPPPTSPE